MIAQGDGWFESRHAVFEKELMNNSKLFGMKKRVVPTLTMSKYTIIWKKIIGSINFKWKKTRRKNVDIMYPNIMRKFNTLKMHFFEVPTLKKRSCLIVFQNL